MNKTISLLFISLFFFNYLLALNFDQNTYINTKNITYDSVNNRIELGDDSLINYDGINILTNKGIIDYNNNTIEIDGNFYLQENQNVLSGTNLKGFLDYSEIDAFNINYIYNNDLSIDSESLSKRQNVITFNNSFITPCKIDGVFNCPTWSIKVPKTKYDVTNDKFKHYDIFFQIADYKVFYSPYLSHYGNKADRKKGFLYPTIRYDIIGKSQTFSTPYYIPFNQTTDMDIHPYVTLDNNLKFKLYEQDIFFRSKKPGGEIYIDIHNELNEDNNQPYSSINLNTTQTVSKNNRIELSLFYTNNISKSRSDNIQSIPFENIYLASENYNILNPNDLLKSKISTVASFSEANNSLIPIELPSINYSNNFYINNYNFYNNLGITYLKRDQSDSLLPLENKKISLETTFLKNYFSNNYSIRNKGDISLNYNETNFSNKSVLEYEKLNSYAYFSSDFKKAINDNSNARLKFIIYSDIIKNNFLVNENSNSVTFNYTNLFNENRLFGSDLIDNSSRIVYGLENKIFLFDKQIKFNIAQSYDSKLNSNYLNTINQNRKVSDFAIETGVKFKDIFFNLDSRINSDNLSKKELNYNLHIFKPIEFDITYNETSKNSFSKLTNDTKSLILSTSKVFGENFSISLKSNLDLKEKYDPYSQSLTLSFFDDCSQFNLTYSNTRFNDNFNTTPTESVRFEFYMDYLGFVGYEQTTNLLNNKKTETYFSEGIF